MNEEMRRFMDGEYDDGMLDIPITCAHCGNEFEIEFYNALFGNPSNEPRLKSKSVDK